MKIFSAQQIKACDAYTIKAAHISSLELMERAASACARWLTTELSRDAIFVVLCGPGNNGGDGLALTRLLHRQGYAAKAFLLHIGETFSADCSLNLKKLQQTDENLVTILSPETFVSEMPPNIIIIDAIFGTGLSRDLAGWPAQFIRHVNGLPNRKIAIDIPSGMPADGPAGKNSLMLKADDTLSFQFYKQSFLHPETGLFTGKVHILDIGLSPTYIETTHTNHYVIDEGTVKMLYRPRQAFSHKGSYGTAMIVGGSYGMMGALVLALKGASRSGAGKVVALAPDCGYSIVQTTVPETMCSTNGQKNIEAITGWEGMQAIGIGPGMGTDDATIKAFNLFIEACKQPLVIDADALNILATLPELLHKLPPHSILTPHPKEFERLFGKTGNSFRRLEYARSQAMKHNIYIILKDRYTAVLTPEGDCFYNLTGNAGLATAGSGDVLTGIITGILAQGYSPFAASVLAVYLHGLAGEMASAQHSLEAMVAGDIAQYLGLAFRTLESGGYGLED